VVTDWEDQGPPGASHRVEKLTGTGAPTPAG
jgi:hypothetical protein